MDGVIDRGDTGATVGKESQPEMSVKGQNLVMMDMMKPKLAPRYQLPTTPLAGTRVSTSHRLRNPTKMTGCWI
jgi:hypothetical protein